MSETQPCRVVVVDDTPEIRMVVRTLLGLDEDVEVVGEAKNGLEAIQLAGEHRPDVVVLDIAMPVMDGMEAIPEIARVSPETSIVMYSAHASPELQSKAIGLGAHHFVKKGGDPTELVDRVHEECAAPGCDGE